MNDAKGWMRCEPKAPSAGLSLFWNTCYIPSMDTQRLYLDTEFNEYQGELISMALVDPSGHEFYEVLDCAHPKSWVAEHVMPFLQKDPVSRGDFQALLAYFLQRLPGYPPTIEIVADWPDDIRHFCDVCIPGPGTKIALPRTLHFTLVELPDFNSAAESKLPHNALADARALMRYCTDSAYMPGWGYK